MSNHAVVIKAPGEAQIIETSIPELRGDYILVKVHAVALNPTDWQHVFHLAHPGARVGCDYAGVVEEVGAQVSNDLKKGDRVAGVCHGANAVCHEDGSFGQYITAKGDIQMKIPPKLSFEEASTLGVGITTVGQSLYQSLAFPLPNTKKVDGISLLIYGGSTATGSLAIQFAKLSGLHVVTTCSKNNFDYVTTLGADSVFDYHSPTCSADIKDHTADKLHHVLDCISTDESMKISVNSMSPSGGIYSSLRPVPSDAILSLNSNVTNKLTVAYTAFGEDFTYGSQKFEANLLDFEFAKSFWKLSAALLEKGLIKVHRPSVNEGGKGLEGVLKGMQAMREGKVSGKKLVYTL